MKVQASNPQNIAVVIGVEYILDHMCGVDKRTRQPNARANCVENWPRKERPKKDFDEWRSQGIFIQGGNEAGGGQADLAAAEQQLVDWAQSKSYK